MPWNKDIAAIWEKGGKRPVGPPKSTPEQIEAALQRAYAAQAERMQEEACRNAAHSK